MKLVTALALFLGSASVAGGCNGIGPVVHPKEITLENALKSVGAGLYDMSIAQQDIRTGLLPAEVTVTFNISASATDTDKLVVDVTAVPVGGGAGKVGAETGSTTTANRGNQITVKFTNLLYASNDKLVFAKSPEDVAKLLKTLQEAGIHVYVQ